MVDFDLFLLGETHGLPENAILQTQFYRYLFANKGVSNILLEAGRGEAFLINEYLKTGDKKYLKWTTFGYFNWTEELNSWNVIRDNCSVSTTVFGIDFEREPSFTAAIYFLLDDKNKTLKIQLKARLDTLKYSNDTKKIKQWLNDNIELKNVNGEILEILSNVSTYSNFDKRDENMFKYFKSIYNPSQKYFGRFGTMHTQLDNVDVFAGKLSLQNRVLVVNIHYEDSWYNEEVKVKYSFLNDTGFFSRKTIRNNLDYFNSIAPCEDYIIKLNRTNKFIEKVANKGQYLVFLTKKRGFNY